MSFFSYANFLPTLIDGQIKDIHKRQTSLLFAQLLIMGLSLWLIALATGVPLLTFLASQFFTQEALLTALLPAITGLITLSAVLDLMPIYFDKLKPIDSFDISAEKIAFIKKEVAELSKKAGVVEPRIGFQNNETHINAQYHFGIFKNGQIILTAGFLRSFGMGGLNARVVRGTIAHELGHKVANDMYYIFIQFFGLALTATILLSAMLTALCFAANSFTLATTLPLLMLTTGLFFLIPTNLALLLKYRENMESAADIIGVELTNDVEGMSTKSLVSQNRKLSTLRMLSFLDAKQVGLYLKSLRSLKIPATLEKIKAILLENISYRKKQKKLINSSLLDDVWRKKLAAPTSQFLAKERDSLNAREKQESANQGLLTRFHSYMQSAMNPYPSDQARMGEIRHHVANKMSKSSPA